MRLTIKISCILFLFSLPAQPVLAQGQKGLSLKVHYRPFYIPINGRPLVYYELQLDNQTEYVVELQKLTIYGQSKKGFKPYRSVNGRELAACTNMGNNQQKALSVPAGEICTMYVELEVEQQAALTLRNEIRVSFRNQHKVNKRTLVAVTAPVKLVTPVVLGAPLAEGSWTAVYDPGWVSGHRRVFYADNQRTYLPGRFAIDFIRVDSAGRYAMHNADSIANWFGYRNRVLAAADGTVVSVQDNVAQSATVSGHIDPLPGEASGNYISIKIAAGVYAFYEHLAPGSIRVKQGQQIKKGDVIGLLGFTGQSTGPHLHFHIADRNSRLHAEGLPYVFERFTQVGAYPGLNNFGKEPWKSSRPRDVSKERPSSNSVIVF